MEYNQSMKRHKKYQLRPRQLQLCLLLLTVVHIILSVPPDLGTLLSFFTSFRYTLGTQIVPKTKICSDTCRYCKSGFFLVVYHEVEYPRYFYFRYAFCTWKLTHNLFCRLFLISLVPHYKAVGGCREPIYHRIFKYYA